MTQQIQNTGTKIRYFHYRKHKYADNFNKGGITVAAKTEGDSLLYAISVCSEKDMFCKKTGRDIAIERLNSEPSTITMGELRSSGVLDSVYGPFRGISKEKAESIKQSLTFDDISLPFLKDIVFTYVSKQTNHKKH